MRYGDQKKRKRQTSLLTKKWINFTDWYKRFCNNALGTRLTKKRNFNKLSLKLRMANIKESPSIFISIIIITTIIVTVLSLIGYTFLFYGIIGSSSWYLYVLILTLLTGGISALFYPLIVSSKISTRRRQINHELPFILSELSILASTGITPVKMFRHMARRGKPMAANHDFRKIVYKMDIKGKDIITAISESAKETPSHVFREVLWDLSNMIHQGGDLDVYLRQKADTTMEVKRDMQKEFIEKLGTYSEMYMSLVLTGTLFIAIAAFLIDALQTEIGGLDADTLLLLLSYILIPVIVITVNILISMSYSKN